MIDKQLILQQCVLQLSIKIKELEQEVQELQEGAASDAKSTAGDKHETGRAMMQLEQEKLSKQLNALRLQAEETKKINTDNLHTHIGTGSLVRTNKSLFFVAVHPCKLVIEGQEVYVISLQSPIGQKMVGKLKGEHLEVNQTMYEILDVN